MITLIERGHLMRHFAPAVIVIALFIAPATTAEELWIPAAASNSGLHGTMWTTDLWLQSRVLDAPMEIIATFHPDQAGTTAPEEIVIELQPNAQVEIRDAVASLFDENRPGAIRLRSEHPFSAQSRTANDGGTNGSFGQGIPAFSATEAVEAFTFLGAANRPGAGGVRSNIGILNLGDEEERVDIFARNAETLEDLGVVRFNLGPNGWFQADVFELLDIEDQSITLADVSVLGAGTSLLGYLSRVDNTSGDGTFIAPSIGEFIRIASGTWELKAVLIFEDAYMDWFRYDTPEGSVTVDDPVSGFTTETLYFTAPATFCARAVGNAGSGPGWGTMEIKIDRRQNGGTWHRGRHHYSTEPSGSMDQEYCVELD